MLQCVTVFILVWGSRSLFGTNYNTRIRED